jgi:hypothetical protein
MDRFLSTQDFFYIYGQKVTRKCRAVVWYKDIDLPLSLCPTQAAGDQGGPHARGNFHPGRNGKHVCKNNFHALWLFVSFC